MGTGAVHVGNDRRCDRRPGAGAEGGASDPGPKEPGPSHLRGTQPKAARASRHTGTQLRTLRAQGTAGRGGPARSQTQKVTA